MSLDLSPVAWRKSSYSGGTGSNCVEVALGETATGVRDSKNPGPTLVFGAEVASVFLAGVKVGRFDG